MFAKILNFFNVFCANWTTVKVAIYSMGTYVQFSISKHMKFSTAEIIKDVMHCRFRQIPLSPWSFAPDGRAVFYFKFSISKLMKFSTAELMKDVMHCRFRQLPLSPWSFALDGRAVFYFKGTQDWEFFWLRFWNLRFFFVSYVKILRFYTKIFLIGSFLGEVQFFRVVLGLRGMKKIFELGKKKFIFLHPFWTLNMTQ